MATEPRSRTEVVLHETGHASGESVLFGVMVVVVVPAFEEAARIARVIRGIPVDVDYVVVVDDASTDGTREMALGTGDPRVEVLVHERNRGVGAAITTGYLRSQEVSAGGRGVFVVMAGDGQMHPGDLPALVRPIAEGDADYVKGCRFDWPGGEMPTARRIGGRAFSLLTSVAIGQPISDSQCGYTALAAAASHQLDLEGLWPGYGYPNDLLGQLAARRLRIKDVPVRPVYADEVSRLRLRHLPIILCLVARAWVRRRSAGVSA
jgi:glycosyltransferase involved in cell wall biosynthesis